MSYAQISDMLTRYDNNRLGDLVQDTGQRVPAGSLSGNTVLQTMLDEASGMIDAALQRGQKYAPSDLQPLLQATSVNPPLSNLAGAALWNGLQLLFRLNCDLAYGLLVARRGYSVADSEAMAPRYVEAMALLGRLASGDWIFTAPGPLGSGAGLPTSGVVISQNVALISSIGRIFGDMTVDPNNPPAYFTD